MKKSSCILTVLLFALLLAGCERQGIYYWGDYSNTYYAQTKNPTEQTLAAHLKSLETIIAQSKAKNRLVPPGVHAEYGYIMLKQGKTDLAIASFEQEKSLYPESRIFMDRLIASAKARENSPGDEKAAPDGGETAKPMEGAVETPAAATPTASN